MKINSSSIQMNSYYSAGYAEIKETHFEQLQPAVSKVPHPPSHFPVTIVVSTRKMEIPKETSRNLQQRLLKEIIERMREMISSNNFYVYHSRSEYLTSTTSQYGKQVLYKKQTHTTIYEKESVAYTTKGRVTTSDGREIPFSLEVSLSRSFLKQTFNETKGAEIVILKDPLVINMDCASAEVTNQSFFFDIDSDGDNDILSSLSSQSGFLALDKNEDGVINNGNELFGATSGNGFADLAIYDCDGNNWIDENDAIYYKLKVWTKDKQGNDKLLSLKEADVGAIFLGNVFTGFDLNDETNQTKAHIQSTGFYLHESTGAAGTVQQVDFAI